MSTIDQQDQPAPPHYYEAAPPPPRRKTRALPVTIGAFLATVGSVVAIAGGGVLAVAGSDGTIGSGGQHEISTKTSALVTSTAKIDSTRDVASALGQPKVGITATAKDGGKDVFVGIARTADVDRYLAGAAIDRVTDFGVAPYHLDKHREGSGTATPKAPASQDFWVAKSVGQRADVKWKVHDGSYRAVVMNVDGKPGVKADSHYEVGVPYLSTAGLAAMLAGIIAIGAGIVLIVSGVGGGGSAASTVTRVQPPATAPTGAAV